MEPMTSEEMKGAAGVVFIAGDRVLLLQRLDGTWGFPGGCTEDGETPFQCAIREVAEETGHTIDPLAGQVTQIAVVDNPDGYRFTAFMQCVPEVFPVTICSESMGMSWAKVDQLPAPLFMSCEALLQLAALGVSVSAMDESARFADGNGFVEIKRNPLSKVGVFPYLGKNIPGADPAKVYQVLRPAEELGSPEAIESFKLTPWVNDHAMLGAVAGGIPAEEKGVHGVIGQEVEFDGDTLFGNLKLFSAEQAARIDAGKRPLSLGYRCKFENAPGVFNGQAYDYVQRNIRGNHVASVTDGRMGPEVAVLDHFSFTFDSKDIQMPEETKPAGGAPADMTIAEATAMLQGMMPALQKLMAVLTPAAPAVEVADKAPAAATDGTPGAAAPGAGAAEEEDKGVTAAAMDEAIKTAIKGHESAMFANLAKTLTARDALAKKLVDHVGVFDHTDKTHAEVVAYGLDKLGIKDAPAGSEAVYLDAFLRAKPVPRAAFAMDSVDRKSSEVPGFLADQGVK